MRKLLTRLKEIADRTIMGEDADDRARASNTLHRTICEELANLDDASPVTDELPPKELTWLYSHCRAIGMDCKSDSGKWEEDIALYTTNLTNEIKRLRDELSRTQKGEGK